MYIHSRPQGSGPTLHRVTPCLPRPAECLSGQAWRCAVASLSSFASLPPLPPAALQPICHQGSCGLLAHTSMPPGALAFAASASAAAELQAQAQALAAALPTPAAPATSYAACTANSTQKAAKNLTYATDPNNCGRWVQRG